MRVPGYTIERELARGGMGAVYAARHDETGRRVALKVLLAPEEATPEDLARFAREAQATARLRHENIVGVHELTDAGASPVIVMDLVSGESLRERLRHGPLPASEAARIGERLARALDHAHGRGVLHRDVKPDNVLLSETGPKLTDFGLAKLIEGARERLTRTGEIMGTLAFMSPEQANSGTLDERADVYSLGATLYVMLTGRPPFEGSSAVNLLNAVFSQEPVPPGRHAEVPLDLETICLTCLAKDPQERYPSAAALGDDLARFLSGEPIEAQGRTLWGRLAWQLKRYRWGVAIGCAALAVGLVALFWRPTGNVEPAARGPEAAKSVAPAAPKAPSVAELEVAAKARLAARDWAGAIAQLDRALAQSPDSVPLLEQRGDVRLRKGDPAAARADYTRALSRAPRQRRALLLAKRAESWRREENWERGLADAREALRRDRRCLKAHLEVARIQSRPPVLYSARIKQAIEAAHRAKEIAPHLAEVAVLDVFVRCYIRAASLAQSPDEITRDRPRELADGERVLSGVLEKEPRPAEAYGLRFLIRREQGNHAGALGDLSQWLALDPYARTAERYRDQAVLASQLQQFPRAFNSLAASLAKQPEANTYVVRAQVHWKTNAKKKALADLARAIALDPSCLQAYQQRCWYRREGREAKAGLQDATRLIELATEQLKAGKLDAYTLPGVRFQRAQGYRLRAQFHLMLKRPRKALADLDEVLKHPLPGLFIVLSLERGNVRAMVGDVRGARADYRRGLREIERQPDKRRLREIQKDLRWRLKRLRD